MTDDKKREDAARKRIANEKAHREKQLAATRDASANVKPTPTQEENDLAASGVPVELAPDGSPEQPPANPPPPPEGTPASRSMQSGQSSRGSYSTRSAPAASE
jgi:hypothetical protein